MSTTELAVPRENATEPGPEPGRLATMFASVLPVLRYAGRVRGLLAGSAVLAVAATVCELFPYWLVYRLVSDLLAGTAEAGEFYRWAVVGVLAIVSHAVLFSFATVM
jgi:hypothetical protein